MNFVEYHTSKKMFTTLILLLMGVTVAINASNRFNMSRCDVDTSESTFDLYCPDLDKNVRIVKDDRGFSVECETLAKFNYKIFPQLNETKVIDVKLVNCLIPEEDNSFGPMLKHLSIKATMYFSANNIGRSLQPLPFANGFESLKYLKLDRNDIKKLNENMFHPLSNLMRLILTDNMISELPVNVFHSLVNLTILFLDNNELSFLPTNIFSTLHKLERLKLSNNKLEVLGEGIFKNQNHLSSLFLHGNKLESFTRGMFAGLNFLLELHLRNNRFKTISINALHYVPRLMSLQFGNVDTKCDFPDNIFANHSNLTTLYLQRVRISKGFQLPLLHKVWQNYDFRFEGCEFEYFSDENVTNNVSSVNLITNQKKLKSLSLANNEFTYLPDEIFHGLEELTSLDLSYNNFTTISKLWFRDLHELFEISLDHNHIKSIETVAFCATRSLWKMDLSHNRLERFDDSSGYLDKLHSLNLSNNYLTTIPDTRFLRRLRLLDLGYNNITFLKYGDFVNSNLDIYFTEYKRTEDQLPKLFLNNNPLMCDCSMHSFLLREEDSVKALISRIVTKLTQMCTQKPFQCKESPYFLSTGCPSWCKCMIRSVGIVQIDCSHRGLTMFSSVEHLNAHSLEIYIGNNNLTELPNLQHHQHVIIIQASHNNIEYIKMENLSPSLRFLGLSHNKIKSISADVVKVLNDHRNLELIFFANNPWECDCSTNTNELIAFFSKKMSMMDFHMRKCRLPSGVDYEVSRDSMEKVCSKERKPTENLFVIVIGILVILFHKCRSSC